MICCVVLSGRSYDAVLPVVPLPRWGRLRWDCGSEKEIVVFFAGDLLTAEDTSETGGAGFLKKYNLILRFSDSLSFCWLIQSLLNLIFLTSSSTLLLSTSGKKKFNLHLEKNDGNIEK